MAEEDPFGFGDDAALGGNDIIDPFQGGDDDAAFGDDTAFEEDVGYVPPEQNIKPRAADPQPAPQLQKTTSSDQGSKPPQKAGSVTGSVSVDPLQDNPQKKFERKWQSDLADKDSKAAAKRAEMKAAAQKELAQWYESKRSGSVSKAKTNRAREAEFLAAINDALAAENPWERIMALVDVSNTEKEEGKKDLSRLKGLLIQLKNSPQK
jgi:hypothetical protein